MQKSVNALKGATLISTLKPLACTFVKYCVNALKGATLISTRTKVAEKKFRNPCVNALKGATLISTLRCHPML